MGGRQSKQGEKMMGAEAQGGKSLSKRKARGENKSNRLEDRESARQCRLFAPTLCPRLFFFSGEARGGLSMLLSLRSNELMFSDLEK